MINVPFTLYSKKNTHEFYQVFRPNSVSVVALGTERTRPLTPKGCHQIQMVNHSVGQFLQSIK